MQIKSNFRLGNKIENYRIHFEINEFPCRQSDHDLPLVNGTFHDRFLSRGLPLVDSFICSNVPDPVRIYLPKEIQNIKRIPKLSVIKTFVKDKPGFDLRPKSIQRCSYLLLIYAQLSTFTVIFQQ